MYRASFEHYCSHKSNHTLAFICLVNECNAFYFFVNNNTEKGLADTWSRFSTIVNNYRSWTWCIIHIQAKRYKAWTQVHSPSLFKYKIKPKLDNRGRHLSTIWLKNKAEGRLLCHTCLYVKIFSCVITVSQLCWGFSLTQISQKYVCTLRIILNDHFPVKVITRHF